MSPLLSDAFLVALLAGLVTAGVPLLLAGLGEQISELAGVLNIGIEGMMLAGAYAGFLVVWQSGLFWPGFLAAGAAGLAVAMVMALSCVVLGMNQIVVGIGLTMSVQGVTALLHQVQFSRTYPRLPGAGTVAIPLLSDIPVLGAGLFDRHPVAYGAVGLAALLAVLYRVTHLGLTLRAAGDKPVALDAAGIGVASTRFGAVLCTGALAGLGGGFMAIVGAGLFLPFMTQGAGFIGIVLAMLARGRPFLVVAGAALFGACLAMTTALQVAGLNIPTDVVQMLPFAAVMGALVAFGRRSSLPAALGTPYVRGAR